MPHAAGTVVRASDIIHDYIDYTPTYNGINAIGNALVVARYAKEGHKVTGYVKITMGSTTTFAASAMRVSLPVAPSQGSNVPLGGVYMLDSSVGTGSRTIGVALTDPGLSPGSAIFVSNATGGLVTNLAPWTWATSDILAFEFSYEAA